MLVALISSQNVPSSLANPPIPLQARYTVRRTLLGTVGADGNLTSERYTAACFNVDFDQQLYVAGDTPLTQLRPENSSLLYGVAVLACGKPALRT